MIDLGFLISLSASIIALYGVYLFNQRRDYAGARVTWMYSNIIFMGYFLLRTLDVLDGGLGDAMMTVYFGAMVVSNLHGMFGKR